MYNLNDYRQSLFGTILSGWGVQRGAGTQQILGTSCAGIVLVAELVESCVDPKCRRALVPHDAGFRCDVH